MRIFTLLVFAAALASAEVKITPQKPPVVPAGGTLQFKANEPVTWSLAPGSVGRIDPDGTYHAPADVPVKNTLAGCQVLGNDHIFNTRVDSLPVDARSAEWMALIPPSRVGYYPGWGINFGDSSTPQKKMHFLYTPQNDGMFEMVPWPELKRENGVFSDPKSGVDRHEITIDRQTCDIYELYSPYEAGNNDKCPACTAQSGFKYNSLSPALPTGSVDAAGLLLTPLTLGLEEIRTGAVQHALRVTLKNNIIAPRPVWPARTNAGAWGKIPYGTRFRLKASYDTSHFSQYAQVLLAQLKQYGLILADGGGNFDVSAYTDVTEDPVVESALGEVWGKGPKSSDFEIIDESALMASPEAGAVKLSSEYATPDGWASVIATSKTHNSDVGRARVVLGGVTVGVPKPAEWVQSGVSTRFASWVNGTSNKGVRWSMNPPLGTLAADGHYTAPDVQHPTSTLLTVASAADPKSSVKVALTVMPKGAIRVVVGNATRAPGAPNKYAPDYGPDSDGNMWWRGQAGEVSWGVVIDDWYGQPWPKDQKDISLYYTSRYSFGDMVYSFRVPNGRYKITLLFAQPQCKTQFPKEWRIPFHLETQGKLVIPNFDMGAGIDDACHAPVTASMPADVTDNSLYFALRRVMHGKLTPSPILSAFAIEPNDSPAHLSVNPEKVAKLTIGQQIQFKTIGWQMANKARWSVVKGPGSITPDGLYSAPAAPPSADQQVVLQAASTADPGKKATAEMVFKFGDFAIAAPDKTLVRSLSTQFTPTIDGAKYTNVAWSVSPNIGKMQPDGTYTAPDSLAKDTSVTVTAASKDVTGRSASTTLALKARPDPIRVNCGGSAFKDAQGNTWAADYGFSNPTISYHTSTPIAGAPPQMQQLYQSARYRYTNENYAYNFPLPNGRYAVTLKFADYTFNEPGHYNFDVVLDGEKVLKNFDFDTVNGPKTAADKRFETTVTNKVLSIEFLGHKGGASLNGIEIVPLGESGVSP